MSMWFWVWIATSIILGYLLYRIWRVMSILLEENIKVKQKLSDIYTYYQLFLGKLNDLDKLGAFASHDELGIFFTILRRSTKEIEKYFNIIETKPVKNKKEPLIKINTSAKQEIDSEKEKE